MTNSIKDILVVAMYVNLGTDRFDLSSYINQNISAKTSDIKYALKQIDKEGLASFNDLWRLAETKTNFANYKVYGKLRDSGIALAESILKGWTTPQKIQAILKFISDQHESNPNSSSFAPAELRVRIFYNLVTLRETEYFCRMLAKNGDVMDATSKDGIEIGYIPSTDDALYSNKYLTHDLMKTNGPVNVKNYVIEISEAYENKYLKVELRDRTLLRDVAAILQQLASVKKVNLSASKGVPDQNLTVYPNKVYDVSETKAEVDFTLKNYFETGRLDPVFPTQIISDISEKAYGQIIDLILTLGKNLEKFQDLYEHFSEERFRDFFLPYLNTVSRNHTTTGEAFNKIGKTDILIQDSSGANIFIAECKLWKGAEELKNAITQLLERYVTWRDEKVALIIFNKDNKKFTELIQKAIEAVKNHPLYFSGEVKRHDTSFSFVFRNADDPQKRISLELILFNCTRADAHS
jgi:hypothetical protein